MDKAQLHVREDGFCSCKFKQNEKKAYTLFFWNPNLQHCTSSLIFLTYVSTSMQIKSTELSYAKWLQN